MPMLSFDIFRLGNIALSGFIKKYTHLKPYRLIMKTQMLVVYKNAHEKLYLKSVNEVKRRRKYPCQYIGSK
jgi:hypothetical protein